MRLAKSIKVILGIVATSSAALVLSGSAFASSTGTSTTSETMSNTTTSQQTGDAVAQVKTSVQADPGEKTDVPKETSVGLDAGQDSTASQAPATVAPAVNGTSIKAGDVVLSAGTKLAASNDVSGIVNSITSVKAESIAAGRVDNTTTVSHDGILGRGQLATTTLGASASQSSQIIAPTPDVVFGSAMLPVQPKITNSRYMGAEDLASLVPSAPAQQQNPANVPSPSHPTGLLTRLTSELAGVVVPHAFSSQITLVTTVAAQLTILLASMLLLTSIMLVTFGARLRRAGYVHAARSDVADNLGSLFATPVRLSYVPALQPSHSSFLMVSETKILS